MTRLNHTKSALLHWLGRHAVFKRFERNFQPVNTSINDSPLYSSIMGWAEIARVSQFYDHKGIIRIRLPSESESQQSDHQDDHPSNLESIRLAGHSLEEALSLDMEEDLCQSVRTVRIPSIQNRYVSGCLGARKYSPFFHLQLSFFLPTSLLLALLLNHYHYRYRPHHNFCQSSPR